MTKKFIPSLLILVAFLTGCGGREKSPLPQKEGIYGGCLYLSTISDPKSFNIILAKETSTTSIVGLLFEGLTHTNGVTTEVEPWLAKKWEISEDGRVWTFWLRDDVKWFDGTPFTSQDVVFTFNELIYNESIPTSSRDIFTIYGEKIKVEALTPYKVRFILPRAFAPFLRALGQPILPAHRLKKAVEEGKFNFIWGIDTPPEEIIGTGPFMLKAYLPGQRVILVRNPNYWKKDTQGRKLPYLERIVFLIVPSQDVALLKFKAYEIDALGIRGEDYPILKPLEEKLNFTIYNAGPAFGSTFLCFNLNPGKDPHTGKPYVPPYKLRWFQDIRFRRAVAYAIDKQTIINNVMNGFGYPQNSAMEEAARFFHNPRVRKYPYDLETSRKLLKEMGFEDRDGDGFLEDLEGNRLEFTLLTNSGNTVRERMGVIIQDDLKKVGMKVIFKPIDFNSLVAKLDSTYDWEAVIIGLTGGVEPHHGKNVWHSSGHLHLWHPKQKKPATSWEKEIDEIFEKGAVTLDPEERRKLYFRWQEIVAEKLPLIFTVNPAALYAIRNKFGNLKPTAYGGMLHNIEEIYLKK